MGDILVGAAAGKHDVSLVKTVYTNYKQIRLCRSVTCAKLLAASMLSGQVLTKPLGCHDAGVKA